MPLPITRGAASAKAFGWTKQSGGAGYPFVAMGGNGRASVLKTTSWGTTPTGTIWTPPPTQPTGGTLNGIIGVVSDGSFIATTMDYSINNGASWTQYTGGSSTKYLPGGLNGSIAYSTVSKRSCTFVIGSNPKTGSFVFTPTTISRTGTIITSPPFEVGPVNTVSNITYSPVFDYFYINGYGSIPSNYRYISAAAPGSASSAGVGQTSGYRPGISDDGYPIIPLYLGGTTFQLRKYTTADLSTYTTLGTVSDGYFGQSAKSPWLWYPVNNKYIVAAGQTSQIFVQGASSGSPASLSLIGSFSIGSTSIQSVNVSEDATGKLLCAGVASFTDPKGGTNVSTYTFFSTDGGVTWVNYLQTVIGATKNFS